MTQALDFKAAAHSLGAVVALSLTGALVGTLSATGVALAQGTASATGRGFSLIGGAGLFGGLAGGVLAGGALAVTFTSKTLRPVLLDIVDRRGRPSRILPALGLHSVISVVVFLTVLRDWYAAHESLTGNLILVAVLGVCAGVGGGLTLWCAIALLAGLGAVADVLARVLYGFARPARRAARSGQSGAGEAPATVWPIRMASALMPAAAAQRWREDFAEACYDFDADQHPALLGDFLFHAPSTVLWAWVAALRSPRTSPASRRP
ncbi:hypothetical protein ACWC3X_42040 [Streptomyces populi]